MYCVCMCVCLTYQHKVDIEAENLMAHVHTKVVAEVVSQVGEGSG